MKQLEFFKYAFKGTFHALKSERNMKVHIIITLFTIGLGFYLNVSSMEWCFLILCIILVISAELLNTSIEKICDFVHPEYEARIGIIKDIAAGAVLTTAIGTFIIAVIIFGSKLI